jgi:hypothetical protein
MVQMRANPEGKKIFRVKSVNGRGKVTIEEEKGGATEAVPGRALFRRLATPPYLTTKLIASLFPSSAPLSASNSSSTARHGRCRPLACEIGCPGCPFGDTTIKLVNRSSLVHGRSLCNTLSRAFLRAT